MRQFLHTSNSAKRNITTFVLLALTMGASAQTTEPQAVVSFSPAHITLASLAIIQLLFIIGLSVALGGVIGDRNLWKEMLAKGSRQKTLIITGGLFLLSLPTQAESLSDLSTLFSDTTFDVLFGLNVILFLILITLVRIFRNTLNTMTGKVVEEVDFMEQVSIGLTRLVPIEQEEEILMDHSYDGIRELDNVLPPWWVYLFYGTIIWGFGYLFYYHVSKDGDLSAAEYQNEMIAAKMAIEEYRATRSNLVDENSAVALTDDASLQRGKAVFDAKCFTCHGKVGEGNSIGPNLTDEYWLHGGGIKNVFTTIKYGVPEKGMIPWGKQMSAGDIQDVASYVLSLQGSKPANGKSPQGEIWSEASENVPVMSADSIPEVPADTIQSM